MSSNYKFVCPRCGANSHLVEVTHGLAELRTVSGVEVTEDGSVYCSTEEEHGIGEIDEDDSGTWTSFQCAACHASLPGLDTMVKDGAVTIASDEHEYLRIKTLEELSDGDMSRMTEGYAILIGALTGCNPDVIQSDICEAAEDRGISEREAMDYVLEKCGFPTVFELWLQLRSARTGYNKMTKEERHRSSYKG